MLGRLTLVACLFFLSTAVRAATISWANPASGNWSVAANWSPALVPGPGDDAMITVAGTYTVTMTAFESVLSLTLGGPSGTQTLDTAGNTLFAHGGTINSNGVVNVSGGSFNTDPFVLTVSGTINWSGGTINDAAITSTGTLLLSGPAVKTAFGTWLNAGTVTWTGTGAFNVPGISTFHNQSGGNFNVQSDATLDGTFSSSFFNDAGGTFTKSVTAGTTTVNPEFPNSGTVSLQTGLLSVMSASGYRQGAGATHLLGGNLSTPGSSAVISGGVLDGNGTFTGVQLFVTGTAPFGQVNPGNSAGLINVAGTFFENLNATYNAEIGGLTPGALYDQINVTGTVTVGGILNVSLIGGFTPAVGNQFVIVNNGSASPTGGSFAGLGEGAIITLGGTQLKISYVGGDGNDVVLTAIAAAPPTPTSTPTPIVTSTPTPTPTNTPVGVATATPTPTNTPAGVATATPTPTVAAATIPTLSLPLQVFFGLALFAAALFLLTRRPY